MANSIVYTLTLPGALFHDGFELMLYILKGKVPDEFGHILQPQIENTTGDFIYIKPGVPHEVFNMSESEPVVTFVARSNANKWDEIISPMIEKLV